LLLKSTDVRLDAVEALFNYTNTPIKSDRILGLSGKAFPAHESAHVDNYERKYAHAQNCSM
jgi:hypothetical protein